MSTRAAAAASTSRLPAPEWLWVGAATVAWTAAYRTILPIWNWAIYDLVGIGIGAAIHGWVPETLFVRIASPDNVFAVPLAVLLGIPLYSNVAGILPLVGSLQAKGLAMGTLLAFMMAVVALSLPEMILLRRVLKPRLIAVFVAVVGSGIIFTGYLFNAILG